MEYDPRKARRKARGAWYAMHRRCNDPKHPWYRDYGRRGIRVSEEFLSFERFLAEVGLPPSPEHSIDRIDANDHYRPGNVRWATRSEQAANNRDTVRYFWRGKKQPLVAWAQELGQPYHALNRRLKQLGWSVEKAFSTPVRPWGRKTRVA